MSEDNSVNPEEVKEEYYSSLRDLTINSKPLICMLTTLAEENAAHARYIVEVIEDHLQKVSSESKLPVLYLIDSIVKNVNKPYLALFTKNIVSMFCCVFEKVDETTRSSMWKMRQTWAEVFPLKKLYALDLRVHNIDPAWPVIPLPKNLSSKPTHANSKSVTSAAQTERHAAPAAAVTPAVVTTTSSTKLPPSSKSKSNSEAEMRDLLLKKQKELIELQKQKVELELLQAKASLEQQRRQLDAPQLKSELPILPEDALEQLVAAATTIPSIPKPLEKTFSGTTSALFKTDAGNKSGVKIAPASSIAVQAVKSVVASRDPRLKQPLLLAGAPAEGGTLANNASDDSLKQRHQLMQQLKLHMQAKSSSLLNDTIKGVSEPSNNNKRAIDSQKKEPLSNANAANTTTPQRSSSSSSNISNSSSCISTTVKDQSKSSTSCKSSSSRSSSSSSSSSSSKSSSSTSRKPGSKSRSKSSSSTSSPSKVIKLDDSPTNSPEKRSSSKKSSKSSRKNRTPSPTSAPTATSNGSSINNFRIPRRVPVPQDQLVSTTQINSKSIASSTKSADEERPASPSSFWQQNRGGVPNAESQQQQQSVSFKEITSNARLRNYVRRNKENSPEVVEVRKGSPPSINDTSKDEDLRARGPIVLASSLDAKEDLDLRVLTVPGAKRPSDLVEQSNAKKSKADKFDALFGDEDVDLRTLTNPNAGRAITPPSSGALGTTSDKGSAKDGSWAKLKTHQKSDRDREGSRILAERNRGRGGHLFKTPPKDPKDRRPRPSSSQTAEFDKQSERNADRNIEIIMKQAAEQLSAGSISKAQYNNLIQEVLHMSEDQKLRAAQRKEQEMGMMVWEKSGMDSGNDEANSTSRKDYSAGAGGMHPRGGPRWQGAWHQSWPHPPPGFPAAAAAAGPPGFADGFRPGMGSWQNHPRMFGGPMRPDFPPPPPQPPFFNPRMGLPPPTPLPPPPAPSMSLPSNGPMMMMPNGPHPMGVASNGPCLRAEAAVGASASASKRTGSPSSQRATSASPGDALVSDEVGVFNSSSIASQTSSGELPAADPKLLEDISKDTMKSINIDSVPREIRYYGNVGVVFMRWDDPRDIGFQDGVRRIFIDGKDSILCKFNDDYKEFTYDGEIHRIKLGTPTRELYIDDKWYECYFGTRPITIELGNKKVSISLDGPPPQVKIGTVKRTDIVLGKINLIINARNMVPVFLDAKPQMFEIDGKPCTLEFSDALQTVLLNGRPFKVEFGGLPKPIIVQNKKHFIRFSVLPRGFRAGYVKITGMRGEQPKEHPTADKSCAPGAAGGAGAVAGQSSLSGLSSATTTSSTLGVPPGLDLDSSSQDGMDVASGSRPDMQLDVLSSVVPSAMAPSSGLSYQAEPVENPPAPAPAVNVPLNLNELFQRLVETGIVPALANLESKKQQAEETRREPEIIPVTFDKPETLKTKQPAIVSTLYSGMQCSSCGARFAPEMATRYSRHLDWHFRQNRKERDSARKAHSRSWYYDVSDWIQFEEIEDLEDRAQSWFETEKQTAEMESGAGDESPSESQQQSVPTGSGDSFCEVCHEAFEQFYNEEKEEWHIRPTVCFEDKNYHPLCLEDHKRALEKSALELEKTMAEISGKPNDGCDEIAEDENMEDINQDAEMDEIDEEKIVIKIEKGDINIGQETIENVEENIIVKEEKVDIEEEKIEEPGAAMDADDTEPIEIIEPLPRKIELEEIEDSSGDEAENKELILKKREPEEKIPDDVPLVFENVKVKEEPVDDDERAPEESLAEAKGVDTTQVEVKSSIDGNVELESTAPTIPAATSKIKINISKPLNNPNKEPNDTKVKEKKPAESPVDNAPAKPLIPAAIKPALQGKKLSILPTVERGHELSGLCSVM